MNKGIQIQISKNTGSFSHHKQKISQRPTVIETKSDWDNLKRAMTNTPTLAMPNFNDTFIIETDASGDGIGAVLQQQGKPIAFMSRALGITKKSWSVYNK